MTGIGHILGWNRGFCGRGLAVAAFAIALSACATVPHHAYHPAAGSYRLVRVEMGDTLSEIAQRYRVDEDDIAAMNRLHDHDVLYAGELLRVPAYGRVANSAPPRPTGHTRPQPQPQSHPHAHTPAPALVQQAHVPAPTHVAIATTPIPIPKPHWQDSTPPSSGITHVSLPPPESDQPTIPAHAQFMWPLDGIVISNFGSRTGGERNDGINIACTGGEEIRAAGDGTVSYAGNELKAYGNLVLIRHGANFTTAYAHVDRIMVKRGEHVTRGQIIAYAGSTGDVAEPQLHFELRRGTTPVDPRPYLATNGP